MKATERRIAELERKANPAKEVFEVWHGDVGFPEDQDESSVFTCKALGLTLTREELDARESPPGTKTTRILIVHSRHARTA